MFWTLFEQAGSSLTLYADRNTDLVLYWTKPFFTFLVNVPIMKFVIPMIGSGLVGYCLYLVFGSGGTPSEKTGVGIVSAVIAAIMLVGSIMAAINVKSGEPYVMPAAQTQIFNPIFIVIFAPIMSVLWIKLGRHNLEPSIPVKFAIGLLLVGLGFLTLVYGSRFANETFRVGLFWLGMAYFLHSIGELCLSPVGLSMITKLSIARVVGLMMGVWFLSSAMALYVGGVIAQFTATETVGGNVTDPHKALETYVTVFNYIGWAGVAAGGLLLVLAIPLKRMMHGVK